jgi:hydroxymethylglutaryl-CoA lyase
MILPSYVHLTEVGMRDGFQMERRVLPTEDKVEIGLALIGAGLKCLEVTSFVSPSAVPQLADAAEVVARLRGQGAELSALVPNIEGARRAVAAGVERITVFVSASETHNLKNVRRPVADSLANVAEIGSIAIEAGVSLSGAVSVAFGCPFEGDIGVDAVLRVVDAYVAAGADAVSLGDTTGMATPRLVDAVYSAVRLRHPSLPVALHFHNTRGLGLVNVMTGLMLGVDRYESCVGGLGGCPFAVGATGNVCTEDLVHMLDELGVESGVELDRMIDVSRRLETLFGRELPGQVMKAGSRLHRANQSEVRSQA